MELFNYKDFYVSPTIYLLALISRFLNVLGFQSEGVLLQRVFERNVNAIFI